MQTTKSGFTAHDELSIVRVNGFKPESDEANGLVDRPGDANWFCEQYGMAEDCQGDTGIIWTDYEAGCTYPWAFAVLIDTGETEALESFAREVGYEILSTIAVDDPTNFGDGHAGTVEILKHRHGWIVTES